MWKNRFKFPSRKVWFTIEILKGKNVFCFIFVELKLKNKFLWSHMLERVVWYLKVWRRRKWFSPLLLPKDGSFVNKELFHHATLRYSLLSFDSERRKSLIGIGVDCLTSVHIILISKFKFLWVINFCKVTFLANNSSSIKFYSGAIN